MIALDYTSRIDPVALRAAGVSDVCRYLCWSPVGDWKNIRKPEYNELLAAGIGVTLNWEYDARDWANGESVGVAHGTEAVRQARALDYPAGRTIIGSADFDMTRATWDTSSRFYARGFAAAIRTGGYRPGVYGPWDVLTWVRDAGLMDVFWQAGMSTAWSGGRNRNPWPGAHLRQRWHITVGGHDTDLNDILIPDWGQARRRTVQENDVGTLSGVQKEQLDNLEKWRQSNQDMKDNIEGVFVWTGEGPTGGEYRDIPNQLVRAVKGLQAAVAAIGSTQRQPVQVDAAAVAAALAADPTFRAALVEAARQGAEQAEDS